VRLTEKNPRSSGGASSDGTNLNSTPLRTSASSIKPPNHHGRETFPSRKFL
jgi:hypothetical protein